jgi:chemosensory pili system protein ChpA (sensor histidine kinase/response regulator)
MCKLLLVDDDGQLLDFYRLVLEHAGHEVRTAETCQAAVDLLTESDPAVIIMDLRLPEIADGLALIRTLKKHQYPPDHCPPKVIVSSGWTDDLLPTAEKDWVDRVLPKPLRMEVLLQSISELSR